MSGCYSSFGASGVDYASCAWSVASARRPTPFVLVERGDAGICFSVPLIGGRIPLVWHCRQLA